MRPLSSRTFRVSLGLLILLTLVLPSTPALAWNHINFEHPNQTQYGYDNFTGVHNITGASGIAQIDAAIATWNGDGSAWQWVKLPDNVFHPTGIRSCNFGSGVGCEAATSPNVPAITNPPDINQQVFVDFNADSNFNWSTACPTPQGQTDFQTIALHELGHALDLGDLYNQNGFTPWNPPDSVMGEAPSPDNCRRALGQDDLDGLFNLHGYRYYVPGITTNTGWTTTLGVASAYGLSGSNAHFKIRLYGGTLYSSFTVYTTATLLVSGTNTYNFQVKDFLSSVGAPPGTYSATVDGDTPITVVTKFYNSASTVADAVGEISADGNAAWGTVAQSVPPVSHLGVCPEQGNHTVWVPLVMNNNAGWSTQIAIQDLGPSVCSSGNSVYVRYYNPDGTQHGSVSLPLGEERSTIINQLGSGAPTVGAAEIMSVNNLGVTVTETKSPLVAAMSFKGFGTAHASPTNFLPLVQNGNHGWYSGLQIQNTGDQDTTVRVFIRPDNGSADWTWTTPTIHPHGSYTLYPLPQTNFQLGAGYASSTNGEQIAVVVNQVLSNGTPASTYSAFSQGIHNFMGSFSNTYSEPGGNWTSWNSGLRIQNIDNVSRDLCFYANGASWKVTLPGYAAYAQYPIAGQPPGTQMAIESGTCTPGGNMVGMANGLGASGNDSFYSYDGSAR